MYKCIQCVNTDLITYYVYVYTLGLSAPHFFHQKRNGMHRHIMQHIPYSYIHVFNDTSIPAIYKVYNIIIYTLCVKCVTRNT